MIVESRFRRADSERIRLPAADQSADLLRSLLTRVQLPGRGQFPHTWSQLVAVSAIDSDHGRVSISDSSDRIRSFLYFDRFRSSLESLLKQVQSLSLSR